LSATFARAGRSIRMPPTRATHLRSLAVLAVLLAAMLVQTSAASAAPPPNDARSAPAAVGALPATISGTTVESTVDSDEPPSSCGALSPKGSVWYALSNANRRDLLVALDAGGDMDATVEVFERQRSQVSPVGCQTTNRRGEATVDFTAGEDSTYLIRIAPNGTKTVVQPTFSSGVSTLWFDQTTQSFWTYGLSGAMPGPQWEIRALPLAGGRRAVRRVRQYGRRGRRRGPF